MRPPPPGHAKTRWAGFVAAPSAQTTHSRDPHATSRNRCHMLGWPVRFFSPCPPPPADDARRLTLPDVLRHPWFAACGGLPADAVLAFHEDAVQKSKSRTPPAEVIRQLQLQRMLWHCTAGALRARQLCTRPWCGVLRGAAVVCCAGGRLPMVMWAFLAAAEGEGDAGHSGQACGHQPAALGV